jgi:predicted acetyltransferase
VNAFVSPQDPVHLLVVKEAERESLVERWMVRLLDAPAAVAARGWPDALELDVPLTIRDAELSNNSGDWRLQISSGRGRLDRTGPPDAGDNLALDARGLAGLFAGIPVSTLRRVGTATGGSISTDARLDAAFAGPTPYMLDYF